MAIAISSRQYLAISRDSGTTWLPFPGSLSPGSSLPTAFPDPTPHGSNDDFEVLDGTKQKALYWDLVYTFGVLSVADFYTIYNLWDASNQNILLNYQADNGQWYYAPAIWSNAPLRTPGANLYRDVSILFSKVEWYMHGAANAPN